MATPLDVLYNLILYLCILGFGLMHLTSFNNTLPKTGTTVGAYCKRTRYCV